MQAMCVLRPLKVVLLNVPGSAFHNDNVNVSVLPLRRYIFRASWCPVPADAGPLSLPTMLHYSTGPPLVVGTYGNWERPAIHMFMCSPKSSALPSAPSHGHVVVSWRVHDMVRHLYLLARPQTFRLQRHPKRPELGTREVPFGACMARWNDAALVVCVTRHTGEATRDSHAGGGWGG